MNPLNLSVLIQSPRPDAKTPSSPEAELEEGVESFSLAVADLTEEGAQIIGEETLEAGPDLPDREVMAEIEPAEIDLVPEGLDPRMFSNPVNGEEPRALPRVAQAVPDAPDSRGTVGRYCRRPERSAAWCAIGDLRRANRIACPTSHFRPPLASRLQRRRNLRSYVPKCLQQKCRMQPP